MPRASKKEGSSTAKAEISPRRARATLQPQSPLQTEAVINDGGAPTTADGHSDREKRIRQTAYQLWEEAGRPRGQEQQHWDHAQRLVDGEDAGH